MDDSRHREALCARFRTGERLKYLFFWGHHDTQGSSGTGCFSQWYGAPFVVNGQRYPTAEHFMMAEKAALFGDEATRARILVAPSPGTAKALGRQVRGFDEARWAAHRFETVVRANTAKFEQNSACGDVLRSTGARVLVEASPVDRIWGIGLAQDDERARNPIRWRGLNLLGFALMQVRSAL